MNLFDNSNVLSQYDPIFCLIDAVPFKTFSDQKWMRYLQNQFFYLNCGFDKKMTLAFLHLLLGMGHPTLIIKGRKDIRVHCTVQLNQFYLNFQFRNVCTVKTQKIKKYSPETTCEKVPTELCAPPGCGFKEVKQVPKHVNHLTTLQPDVLNSSNEIRTMNSDTFNHGLNWKLNSVHCTPSVYKYTEIRK